MTLQPWQVMWGLAVIIFAVCKYVTWSEVGRPLNARGIGYLFAWPGLDARTFMYGDGAIPPSDRGWSFALAKTFFGAVLYFEAAKLMPNDLAKGWVGMIGIVFILHFGLFHLLSCVWRSNCVDAEPLMNWPIASKNLGDFWGKRWNTAFRNLTHKFLFRPLLKRVGSRNMPLAVFGSFLFSGLVHDAVISLPAGGGYGGPTAYFVLQGLGILLEFRLRKDGVLFGWWGRLYAMAFLVIPVGRLFHPPFVLNVVVPFMKATGALS